MMKRAMLLVTVLAALGLTGRAAGGMDLGTNFWNLGWHKAGDCFKDVKNVTGDDPWNPQFLKDIAVFKSLRFMDWDNTNGSAREKWSERSTKAAPKQNPVAYEWMMDLCNRNNADLWVTIPHRTINRTMTDQPCDYALRLCILVKTGVDTKEVDLAPMLDRLAAMKAEQLVAAGGAKTCEPLKANLRLYVEYSNETWNGAFKQSHYCCGEGTALGLDKNEWTAGFRYHAWAALRLFRAADLVFGADSKRVVKVLASHTANSWVTQQHVGVMADPKYNPWNTQANAIATAPYFGHKVEGTAADAVAQLRDAIRKCSEDSARQKKVAGGAGLLLIAYEGGQHVIKKARDINRYPAMHDLYAEYLKEMSKHFTHFSHYAHVGGWGDGGAWGSMEYTGQPLGEAHKYRALVEWGQVPARPADGRSLGAAGQRSFADSPSVAGQGLGR